MRSVRPLNDQPSETTGIQVDPGSCLPWSIVGDWIGRQFVARLDEIQEWRSSHTDRSFGTTSWAGRLSSRRFLWEARGPFGFLWRSVSFGQCCISNDESSRLVIEESEMGKQDELATFIRQVEAAGLDVGNGCVVANGVFSRSLQFARVFAQKHNKDLVRVDGQISGWLARNKPSRRRRSSSNSASRSTRKRNTRSNLACSRRRPCDSRAAADAQR